MLAHTSDPSMREAEAGRSELEVSLVYEVRSDIARATQRNTASKKKKQKTEEEEKKKKKRRGLICTGTKGGVSSGKDPI